jgi:hypothetical protein
MSQLLLCLTCDFEHQIFQILLNGKKAIQIKSHFCYKFSKYFKNLSFTTFNAEISIKLIDLLLRIN